MSQIEGLAENELLLMDWETKDGHKGRDWFAPRPYKNEALQNPGLNLSATKTTSGYELTLTSQAPAFFVAVETTCPGRFSDNAVLVMPDEPVVTTFTPSNLSDSADFTLNDLYSATYPA